MKKMLLLLIVTAVPLLSNCVTSKNALVPMMYEYELGEAKTLIKANKNMQAIDELNMLIQMDPKNVEALETRALAYQKINRFERAVTDYEQVIALSRRAPRSRYNLGMIYAYKLNVKKKALRHFDAFLTLEPYNDSAFDVAKIMRTIDHKDGVATSPQARTILALARQIQDPDRRRQKLQEGMEAMPNSPVFYYLTAESFEADGTKESRKKAVQFYELAIEKRPTCARCQLGLGNVLTKMNRQEEGRLHLRKAELFDPNASR